MPFSERQLHCLNTMGIVPWVHRHVAYQAPAVDASEDESLPLASLQVAAQVTLQVAPDAAAAPALTKQVVTQAAAEYTSQTATTDQAEPTVRTPIVAPSADDFAHTPLVALQHRGQSTTYIGPLDAALLILVEATSSVQVQFPFEAADARMFEDMLRGIGWRRQDVCLAVLNLHGNDQSTDAADGIDTVGALLSAQRRAILIFSYHVGDTLNTEDVLQNIGGNEVNGWRLPHPALLRLDPQRKRLAWNVLKAARARLVQL